MSIYYRYDLKERARQLRKNCTIHESILWDHLRKKQIKGYRFRRQKPIGNYIVDFYCPKLKLIIEVDGKIHEQQVDQDKKRQAILESLGFSFLRFSNSDVVHRIDEVLCRIQEWIEENEKTPRPASRDTPPVEGNYER